MNKFGIFFVISMLLIPTMAIQPQVIYSNESQDEQINMQVKLYSNEENIGLYEDITGEKLITRVPNHMFVTLLDEQSNEKEKYALVRYTDEKSNEEPYAIEGYVNKEYITPAENGDLTEIQLEMDTDEIEGKSSKTDSEQKSTVTEVYEHNDELPKEKLFETTNQVPQLEVARTKATVNEIKTSKLGHIRNGNVRIYESIGGNSKVAGSSFTNAVYYIKRQATVGNQTYYLISKNASATTGVVGWVKSNDMSVHNHVGVDKQAKTFYLNGKGKTTTKAWGGSKDTVHTNLSNYRGYEFKVHLTEKVGKNTWYRGNFEGKTVWVHASYVDTTRPEISIQESKTSKLGHIRSGNARIYDSIGGSSKSTSSYTNAVYYIKRQATVGNQTYYLISKNASATNGVVGWVKSNDMSVHNHVGVDKKSKTFYLNGKGKTTTKAWGGSKDSVHANLSNYRGYEFKVHLTEKVGGNTWYRGNFEGKTVWVHASYVDTTRPEFSIQESKTSKLGHVRSGNARIYDSIGGSSKSASSYTNAVYYIKRQATAGNQTYYLISKNASATTGVVGWVKSNDMSVHNHVGVDKKSKTFYLNGKGKMTTKAWGGSKDTVYSNLSAYKGQAFEVHLTEKVGNNTWYRGNFKGKTVWVHASYVDTKGPETPIQESETSKLGHVRSGNVRIYDSIGGSSKSASSYTNAVYYIKRQATVGNQTYYLISKNASATTGVVGWVKSNDMSVNNHVGVDKKSKTFYLNGKGKMTTKAWGGSKDTVYANLSAYKGQEFKVHLTEKVGNNTWYRGNFKGKTVWVHSSYVTAPNVIKIFLDPGHGGSDPGALGNGLQEKDLTLDIAKRIEKHLKQYQGVEVKMSRTNDTYYKLEERVKMANDWNADYFVSTHINSFTQESANGFESFIHKGKNGTTEAKKKQKIIHEHIAKNIDEVDRGMKEADFKVLRETNMPAILFEYMFITNKENSNQLKKSAYRDKLARVTAEGIAKAYNLEKK